MVRGVTNGASDVKTASLAADRYEVFFSAGVATLARMLVALQSLFSSTRMRRRAHLLLVASALVLSSVALQADPNEGERNFQIAVAAGFNRILSNDEFVKQNAGAEFAVISTLPLTLWREDANLFAVRAQYTAFRGDIELPKDTAGNADKLFYPSHSQIKADFRQIFRHWNIDWSLGLGFQLPVYDRTLTPLGTFTFKEASELYPEARDTLAKIDRSYAIFLRLGIDQKFLEDALIAGLAIEINAVEFPKTQQRASLNFYVGARVW